MATAEQNSNGKWKITNLYHEYEENVAIPVTIMYNNADPVDYTISHTRNHEASTNWETPIGVRIDTSKITHESEIVPSSDGRKKYRISKINWIRVVPYSGETPSVETHDLYITPTGRTVTCSGTTTFQAWDRKFIDGTLVSSGNVTTSAVWSVNSGPATADTTTKGKFSYKNTGSTSVTAVIKAAYSGNTNTVNLKINKCQDEPKYGTICITGSTPTGATIVIGGVSHNYNGGTQCFSTEYPVGDTISWTASKDGYVSTGGTITIVEGKNNITFTLHEVTPETKYGILQFSGNVTNVKITIDGTDYTYNGGTYTIKEGSTNKKYAEGTVVNYTLSKEGYQPITGSITIVGNTAGDYANLVKFTMEKAFEWVLYLTDETKDNQYYSATTCTGSVHYAFEWCKHNGEEIFDCVEVGSQTLTWTIEQGSEYAQIQNGTVTFNNTSNQEQVIKIKATGTYEGTSDNMNMEITVPSCVPVVDHCEVKVSTTNLEFTGAGNKSVTVSAITHYTNGTSAYTEPIAEWIPKDCLDVDIEESSPYYMKNVVTSARTGSGPYRYSFTLPAAATGASHGGTVKFSSADCGGTSKSVCMKYTKQEKIVTPTFTGHTGLQTELISVDFNFKPGGELATTGICWEGSFVLHVQYYDSNTGQRESEDCTVHVHGKTVTDAQAPNGVSFEESSLRVTTNPTTQHFDLVIDTATSEVPDVMVIRVGMKSKYTIESTTVDQFVYPSQTGC